MRQRTLAEIRSVLVKRRHALLDVEARTSRTLADQQGRDRAAELEESAQVDTSTRTLTTLSEGQAREVKAIDVALSRMETGGYGVCVDCGENIPPERLHALPFATRCANCAVLAEREGIGVTVVPGPAESPLG